MPRAYTFNERLNQWLRNSIDWAGSVEVTKTRFRREEKHTHITAEKVTWPFIGEKIFGPRMIDIN